MNYFSPCGGREHGSLRDRDVQSALTCDQARFTLDNRPGRRSAVKVGNLSAVHAAGSRSVVRRVCVTDEAGGALGFRPQGPGRAGAGMGLSRAAGSSWPSTTQPVCPRGLKAVLPPVSLCDKLEGGAPAERHPRGRTCLSWFPSPGEVPRRAHHSPPCPLCAPVPGTPRVPTEGCLWPP